MRPLPEGYAELYVSVLAEHLSKSDEAPLHHAYALGRQALDQRFSLLDLTFLHHDAMARYLARGDLDPDDTAWLRRGAEFLSECLSAFEMSLRGYQEANERLSHANAELTQAYAAYAAAHEQLKVEMEERKKAEEALVHAKKLQAVGLLAGGVAHHFNNLLTVVIGNIDLARRRTAGDEQVQRLLEAARRGGERGADVTRQLLSFSRQQMLQPRVIDPVAWLEEVRPLLAGALRGDIEVEVARPVGEVGAIEVDPAQLELAVLNLAVNARDAMPDGGVLRLSVSGARMDGRLGLHGDHVVIEVADTGAGVKPEDLPRVFEPFFTTKSGGPGTGLGLSQVHGFTHQSGGAVEMEARPAGGVAVRLYLPVAMRPAAAESARPASEEPLPAASGKILVVEDDADLAKLASALLESFGYSVRLAHRAQAALELVLSGEPLDLVFSDVLMPGGMNGVQLAKAVRQARPDLPILLTSGYNDALEEMREGDLPFIVKPYQADQLRRSIEALLRRGL